MGGTGPPGGGGGGGASFSFIAASPAARRSFRPDHNPSARPRGGTSAFGQIPTAHIGQTVAARA